MSRFLFVFGFFQGGCRYFFPWEDFEMESKRSLMMSIVRLMRPSQWIKNGFVLMPLIFSGRMFVPHEAFLAVLKRKGGLHESDSH